MIGDIEDVNRDGAMRVTKAQAAANRQRILDAAARRFRERGIEGVGLAELMQDAGFTHGGFYNHFASKEALAAEAVGLAFADSRARLDRALEGPAATAPESLASYIRRYLSRRHCDDAAESCPTATLAADAARQGAGVQAVFGEGLEHVLSRFTEQLAATPDADDRSSSTRARAMRLLSVLVGALVLARAVATANPRLSTEILTASRTGLTAPMGRGARATRRPDRRHTRAADRPR